MADKVIQDLASRRPATIDRFRRYLRIASVSTDPSYAAHMDEARQFLLAWLQEIGLDGVRSLNAGAGQPAIYGECLRAPGAPTVLIYAHYDVQPPGPLDEWLTPPFEPDERDGRIYARGAADVKGSTTIALETLAAYLRVEARCPVNVKVFIEGEEEVGSPSIGGMLTRYGSLLSADAIVSADGGRSSVDTPTINIGMRGVAKLQFSVLTAGKDCHSGKYGGAVRNALHEMAALIASLHDRTGAVAVEGFADDAEVPSQQQRHDAAALHFDERSFLSTIGGVAAGDPAFTMPERLAFLPCIDVNGIWGGYTGPGSMTVIPHRASAKLSIRLVPGQSADRVLDAVEAHLRNHLPNGCRFVLDMRSAGAPAYDLPIDHPLVRSASEVLHAISGRKPVPVRFPATVPIVSLFRKALGIDTLMFGFHLPDEDVHAPNEFFRLSSFDEGFRAWPMLLRRLATFAPEAMRGREAP